MYLYTNLYIINQKVEQTWYNVLQIFKSDNIPCLGVFQYTLNLILFYSFMQIEGLGSELTISRLHFQMGFLHSPTMLIVAIHFNNNLRSI